MKSLETLLKEHGELNRCKSILRYEYVQGINKRLSQSDFVKLINKYDEDIQNLENTIISLIKDGNVK